MIDSTLNADPRPPRKFKLIIEYDGTDFCGWQRQKTDPSIQGAIEKALQRMTRTAVTLHGSGRTDAGVHALGQCAHFNCPTRLSAAELQKGLNGLLPDAIAIRACAEAAPDFHARYDVRHKTYHYRILNRPVRAAVNGRYAWHIKRPLDLAAMEAASACLVGRQDFKAFENAGSPRAHTVRHVMAARWERTGEDQLVFEIRADGFLRFMVRNIVGTLVEVGLGKIEAPAVEKILQSGDRRRAGATAPPQGLFLVRVTY
jgi:tRNA pseudouridine38-40 synthase